jgi:tRNA-uridine 2-sulfurtransferase
MSGIEYPAIASSPAFLYHENMGEGKKTVVVGMSGGVDSSVAAALLIEQGYSVIGMTMKTYDFDEVGGNIGNETSCCGLDAFNDARRVAVHLGIPHYVIDVTESFGREVIDNFVSEYLAGRTPNPCVICNRLIKWGSMLRKAEALGADYIATGHYARLVFNREENRYQIQRGKDRQKDQTYALWGVSQESLEKTLFPLGDLTKGEVRQIASRLGLPTAAKGESFEICFVADDDYRRFLRDHLEDSDKRVEAGDIIFDGKVVGRHTGYPFYTIGQRSGIGAHKERVYVTGTDPVSNTVHIGRGAELLHRELTARNVNFVSVGGISGTMRIEVQVRYKDTPAPAEVRIDAEGILHVRFDEPKRAITPGQSVVLYDGNTLLGGGIIDSVAG